MVTGSSRQSSPLIDSKNRQPRTNNTGRCTAHNFVNLWLHGLLPIIHNPCPMPLNHTPKTSGGGSMPTIRPDSSRVLFTRFRRQHWTKLPHTRYSHFLGTGRYRKQEWILFFGAFRCAHSIPWKMQVQLDESKSNKPTLSILTLHVYTSITIRRRGRLLRARKHTIRHYFQTFLLWVSPPLLCCCLNSSPGLSEFWRSALELTETCPPTPAFPPRFSETPCRQVAAKAVPPAQAARPCRCEWLLCCGPTTPRQSAP
jgi:hypothetical protein